MHLREIRTKVETITGFDVSPASPYRFLVEMNFIISKKKHL